MKAYKLVRQRKDGSLGPLFIDATFRIDFGEWYQAKAVKKKGYAFRPGWHCTVTPVAPHLKAKPERVWVEVEVKDFTYFERPESQGGQWVLAQKIKFIKFCDKSTIPSRS